MTAKARQEISEEMNCAGVEAGKNIKSVISLRMRRRRKKIAALAAEKPEVLHRLSSANVA